MMDESSVSKSSYKSSSSSVSHMSCLDTKSKESPAKSTGLTRFYAKPSTSTRTNHWNSKSAVVSFAKPSTSSGSKTARDATSSYQSVWLSALREFNESESPPKEKEVSRKRRYVEEEESTRSGQSIRPISVSEEDDFDRNSLLYSTSRRPYSEKERILILRFVCKRNYHQYVNGNRIWRKLENEKIIPKRTWQSLRGHFIKQMFPKIMNNCMLSGTDKKKFQRAIKIIKLGKRKGAPI